MEYSNLVNTLKSGHSVTFNQEGDRDLFLEWLDLEHPNLIIKTFEDNGFNVGLMGIHRTNQKLWGLTNGEILLKVVVAEESPIAEHNEELIETHRGSLFWAKLTDLELDLELENSALFKLPE